MKLSRSLLLPTLIGAATALSDASVYILRGDEWLKTSTPPTLTPEQARLVFAQRLGTSRYHGLGDASEETLGHINEFGGHGDSLFQSPTKDKAADLVLIVEGISSSTSGLLREAWSSIEPAFTISSPPALVANKKLASDLNQQCGQERQTCSLEDNINPYNEKCWSGKSKVIHLDLANDKSGADFEALISAKDRLMQFAKKDDMNVVVVLMPEGGRTTNSKNYPYGKYDKVTQSPMKRNEGSEAPMTENAWINTTPKYYSKQVQTSNDSTPGNSTFKPIKGVPKLCHSSLDACVSATNDCSGHGQCLKKYGNDKSACYTCFCTPSNYTFTYASKSKTGVQLQYWGGSACHKKDISDSFWLITIFTVVIIGIVTWSIAMIFSIGEEKLPGVIGAGVGGKSK